jgi:hypothetical protein
MPIVSRAEMERRWATLRQAMAAHDVDAVIATSSAGASDLPVHPRLGLATAGQGLRLIWLRRQPVDASLADGRAHFSGRSLGSRISERA